MSAGRSIVPTVTFDTADLGPCMLALNPGERSWCYYKVEHGLNNMEAARAAGYSASSDDVLKSMAYAISQRQRVQDALLEMSRKLFRNQGPKSILCLVGLRDNQAVKPDVRLKAAVELLNRAGMSAVSEAHLTVTHELSDAAMDQRILALASELGLDEATARKMLIAPADLKKNADAIDAEFTEVGPEISAEEQERQAAENKARRKVRAMSPEELAAHKAKQRAEKSQRGKALRAAAEEARVLAMGREGLEDLLGD